MTKPLEWGSDVAAAMLRSLEIPYIALQPGASYRGLHDSLVNWGGNECPEMLICNHEEVAIDIAHGYARVTGRAMAAAVHSNVGLMHATMPIFSAYVNRAPVLIMGATGPLDATKRRPWIDWIHTSNGQGQLVRDFTKWETQPGSVAAIPEAMLRAWQVAHLAPRGPVYVCLDAGLQEQQLATPPALLDPKDYPAVSPAAPDQHAVDAAAKLLVEANDPAIALGDCGAWGELIALAERLGAKVVTHPRSRTSFPTTHALHHGGVSARGRNDALDQLKRTDVVLAVERPDAQDTVRGRDAKLINVSLEPYAVRSWAGDHQELPRAAIAIAADADLTVIALFHAVQKELRDRPELARRAEERFRRHTERRKELNAQTQEIVRARWDDRPISHLRIFAELAQAIGDPRVRDTIVARGPLGYTGGAWQFEKRLANLGGDGGAAVGSGPGMAVGAALAARGSGRLVVAVFGDGDFAAAPSAVWTAAHHRIPVLIVVQNNQHYGNDVVHQEHVAKQRGRPIERAWIGQRMTEPGIDVATVARGFGGAGFGPVDDPADLGHVFSEALAVVDDGGVAVVDVRAA